MHPSVELAWISGATVTGPGAGRGREASEEFEALLLGQLLRQAREANEGEGANNPMRELVEEHLARVMARAGALGIAAMVGQGMRTEDSVRSGVSP